MNRPRTRPSPRIPRETVQHVRRPDPRRAAQHLQFVRSLPCACCRRAPAQAHHENYDLPDNAMGMKAHDKTAVPLCAICHARRHQIGAVAFWIDTDIPKALMDALWRNSGDIEAGERSAYRASMDIMQRKGR